MLEDLNKLIKDNELHQINTNIYLTNKQEKILQKNNIPYQECQNLNELLFLLNEYPDNEELEDISLNISEFNYYHNTNK